jgi:hypothetical protein
MVRRTTVCLFLVMLSVFVSCYCVPASATTIWYDNTVSVKAGGSYAVYGDLSAGLNVTIQMQVTSVTSAALYIMDPTNYSYYRNDQSFSYYAIQYVYANVTVTWQVPSNQTYYFVLDNRGLVSRGWLSTVTVHLTITYEGTNTAGNGSAKVDESLNYGETPPLTAIATNVAIIGVLGMVLVAATLIARKKRILTA